MDLSARVLFQDGDCAEDGVVQVARVLLGPFWLAFVSGTRCQHCTGPELASAAIEGEGGG